jgi:hypothetical protein
LLDYCEATNLKNPYIGRFNGSRRTGSRILMKRAILIVFVVAVVAIVVAKGMFRTPAKTTNASDIQFAEVVSRLNEANHAHAA